MTATTGRPEPDGPRHKKRPTRRKARFSSMEALGFIETPMMTSTWSTSPPPRPITPPPPSVEDDPFAGWQPTKGSSELTERRFRWGMASVLALIIGGLTVAGLWLWQRPEAMAAASSSEVTTSAETLESELVGLRDTNSNLLAPELDSSAVSAQSLAVDGAARAVFDAAGALSDAAAPRRSLAVDVATTALDASRLIRDAVAYRSAVIQILVAPDLETDPDLIGLDDAVRDFGAWQQQFNQVRSALPTGTMSEVSSELELVAGNLASIQGRYVDALRDDDRLAAEGVLKDLAEQLSQVEESLINSLEEVQARVDDLIGDSLAGIRLLVG